MQERTGTKVCSSASETSSLAFAFSPAGLLFPYYVGVAFQLKELGIIKQSSPLGGSSAGSIVAAALACGVTERSVLAALQELLGEVRAGVGLNPALRKQLERAEPNADRVHALLHRLGEATTRIAEKAETNQEKLKTLGEALTDAGEDQPDEEEDVAAAAAPKRGRAKA